jgi:hypothetical protein
MSYLWKISCEVHLFRYQVGVDLISILYLGDEHPIEFAFESKRSYDFKGAKDVPLKQPPKTSKHRFASLILYFRASKTSPEVPQIRPQIIFRLKPENTDVVNPCRPASSRIFPELRKYDKRVDVLFQENAWADDVTSVASLDLLQAQISDNEESILFLDNLHGHRCREYKTLAKENGIVPFFTPPDSTDLCAVNDHHIGKMVKNRVKKQFKTKYLEDSKEWDDGEVSMSEKRVMMTKFLAEAWESMKEEHDSILKAFQACGTFNAADGSEDHLIKWPQKDENEEYHVVSEDEGDSSDTESN